MRRLLKRSRLLKKNPGIGPKTEGGILSEAERTQFAEDFAALRKEIEMEERGITKKPALGGETEEIERHAVKPVRMRNRGFVREDVSTKIRKWKAELKGLKKYK